MTTALEGIAFDHLGVNTDEATLAVHVAGAIRRRHPQVWGQPMKPDVVAIVGSGPSLADTERELVDLVFAGAKVVTLNGAYQWCLARNIRPSAQIVLDARPSTARFVVPDVPQCRYYVASQCHPDVFDAVAGRPHVGLWHAVGADDGPLADILTDYYGKGRWSSIHGGTSVGTRAIGLLRTLGFGRLHLFGIDCCWIGDAHHAIDQPENAGEKRLRVTLAPSDRPDLARDFWCAPWHLKQLEDLLVMIRFNGESFLLDIHGDGAAAYALRTSADIVAKE